MKKINKNLSVIIVIIISFFSNKGTKAATSKDVTSRVNKIRTVLKKEIKDGNIINLTGNDIHNKNLNEWVNWGNWADWNNWRNWNNWNNWGNWGNWGNY